MMNAMEMRTITNNEIAKQEQAKIDKYNKYINEEIAPMVENLAYKGKSVCKLTIRGDIDYSYVKDALTGLGYEVSSDQHYIIVKW
jgi:hypothetical protein